MCKDTTNQKHCRSRLVGQAAATGWAPEVDVAAESEEAPQQADPSPAVEAREGWTVSLPRHTLRQ